MHDSSAPRANGYGRPDAPFGSYAAITFVFIAALLGTWMLARRLGIAFPERVSLGDMLLFGMAAHKLSWLLTGDVVTSFLRAPFTKFKGWSGPGAVVSEESRGRGLQRALGELFVCPWCMDLWVALAFVIGFVFTPAATRILAALFMILMIADLMQIIYIRFGQVIHRPSATPRHD